MTEVKIIFYGEYRKASGVKETTIEVTTSMSVLNLLTHIANLTPRLSTELRPVIKDGTFQNYLMIVVNNQVADLDALVSAGDEVSILPFIVGG